MKTEKENSKKSTFGDRMSKDVDYKIVKKGKPEKSEDNDSSKKKESN